MCELLWQDVLLTTTEVCVGEPREEKIGSSSMKTNKMSRLGPLRWNGGYYYPDNNILFISMNEILTLRNFHDSAQKPPKTIGARQNLQD